MLRHLVRAAFLVAMLTLGFGVNARNEIAFAQTGGAGGPQTSYVYDAAGNLIFDGERVYRYDAWNRVVQISAGHMGTVYQTSGGGTGNPPQEPVADQLLKHFTYDGLGRLVRTQSPWPDPATAAGEVRSERFYYDGVRRVQEVLLDPLLSLTSALASSNATLQTLAQQASTQNGVPLDGEATPATLEQGQASTLVGGAATFTGVLWREYVWGPGDGPGGVDELLVQFDQNDAAWWALVDACGDVSALAGETGTPTAPGAARVAAQWTYDAYGNVTSADHLHPHALLHCGHKGLFAERLDVGAAEVETPGFANAESPRLVPFGRIVYHNRNRMYSPGIGRFLQADPNGCGTGTLGMASMGLVMASLAPIQPDMLVAYGDGASRHQYLGSSPWDNSDPLGLSWVENYEGVVLDVASDVGRMLPGPNPISPLRQLLSGYHLMIATHAFVQEAAYAAEEEVDWATDWSAPDDANPRYTSNAYLQSLADDALAVGAGMQGELIFAGSGGLGGRPRGPQIGYGRRGEELYRQRNPKAVPVKRYTEEFEYTDGGGNVRFGKRKYDFEEPKGKGNISMKVEVKSVGSNWGSEPIQRVKTQVYKDSARVRAGQPVKWVFQIGKNGKISERYLQFIRDHGIKVEVVPGL